MNAKVIQSRPRIVNANTTVPIPITYYEASLIYVKYRAQFSFIHRDPIDGSIDGLVTILAPAHFIPAILWDNYEMCGACGEWANKWHSCEARD